MQTTLSICCSLLLFFGSLHFGFGQAEADTVLANQIYQKARAQYNRVSLDSAYSGYEEAGQMYLLAEAWEEYLKSRNFMARCQMRKGVFQSAIAIVDSALKTVESHVPEETETTANSYNILGVAYNFLSREEEAIEPLSKALKIREKILGPESEKALSIYVNLGSAYMDLGREVEAMELYEKMVGILEKNGDTTGQAIAGGYYGLGILHDRRWNYDLALEYYEKTLAVWKKLYGPNHPKLSEAYIAIGSSYGQKDEFELSEINFQKALNLYLTRQDENNPRVGVVLFNLGVLYEKMKNYPKALEYHTQALELRRNMYGGEHFSMNSGYNSIGNSHKAMGNLEEAEKNYLKAVELSKSEPYRTMNTHYYALTSLGNIFRTRKAYEKSLQYHRAALSILDSTNGVIIPLGADIMENLGETYITIGNYDSAAACFQRGIDFLEEYEKVNKVNLDLLQIDTYQGQGTMYYKKYQNSSNDPRDLYHSVEAFEQSLDIADNLRQKFLTLDSRQNFIGTSLKILEGSARTDCALMTHSPDKKDELLERIFQNMEKGKSVALLESFNDSRAKINGGLPQAIIDREDDLKKTITRLEEQIYSEQAKGENADSLKVLELEAEIFDLKSDFQNLMAELNNNYPQYISLKYGNKIPPIDQVKKFLGPDRALIEFLVGRETITTLVISQNQSNAYNQIIPKDLFNDIEKLRKSLSPESVQNNVLDPQSFKKLSYKLYQTILQKSVEILDDQVNTLIIVPDGALGYLPFDILISNDQGPNQWMAMPYLINQYQISTSYSASLLLENENNTSDKYVFGGFAAEYPIRFGESDSLSQDSLIAMLVRDGDFPLPGAIDEVNQIASLLKGEAFTGMKASEANFKAKASDFGILHLAMHAFTVDQNPLFSRLIFTPSSDTTEDNFLHAIELYNMKLHAQMTVLSACNTGLGAVKKGEGIMSLSRAFAYAGVPSLVMSLWSVPDKSTSSIMVDFYKGIKEKRPKDEALRTAKLNYLKQTKVDELTHPFYWAGFIPVGDMTPVENSTNSLWYLIPMILLGILGIVLFMRRGKGHIN